MVNWISLFTFLNFIFKGKTEIQQNLNYPNRLLKKTLIKQKRAHDVEHYFKPHLKFNFQK